MILLYHKEPRRSTKLHKGSTYFALYCVLLLAFAFLTACTPEDEEIVENVDNTEVEIRLRNSSAFDYQDIRVVTSEEHDYGNLVTGETSEYQVHGSAYRYAFIELQINGATYTLQPIDYVGEKLLDLGKYTYEIFADDLQGQYGSLSLT